MSPEGLDVRLHRLEKQVCEMAEHWPWALKIARPGIMMESLRKERRRSPGLSMMPLARAPLPHLAVLA